MSSVKVNTKVGAIDFLSAFYDLKYETMYFRLLDDPKTGDIFKQKHESDGDDLRGTLNYFYQENKKKRGVFFVVNGGGHSDAEITQIKAQFVDLDNGTKSEQLEKIQNFSLPPSILVETGKGHHAYWLMKNAKIELFEGIQKQLVKQFDGDPVCINLSRIMRLPQFFHCKKEPVEIRCIKFDPDMVYTQDELAEVLPKIKIEKKPKLKISETVSEGSRNHTLFKLACKLQSTGMPDNVIHSAICSVNNEQFNPPLDTQEVDTIFKQATNKYPKGEVKEASTTPFIILERGQPKKDKDGNTEKEGAILRTIENFLRIFRGDEYFSNIKFNLLSHSPEKTENGVTTKWNDDDDARIKHYIEKKYNLHHDQKMLDAFRIFSSERAYHPIKDLIESIQWDGESRLLGFLNKWLKCDDNSYTSEVSRLIFAGGIHRLYEPGCKFDDVPVFVGTKQGEGKSTFIEWIALKSEFYADIKEMDGQRGIEELEGVWICEIAEMLATTKAKEVEAVKAYITRKIDRYRRPFERRTSDHPRQCIFIGTTNKRQFLTDKTGNRRFYPVEVKRIGYELFDDKKAIMEDIKQCWAEALELYKRGELKPYADRRLKEEILQHQADAVEDDYREGMIEKYLDKKSKSDDRRVCCYELFVEALENQYGKPTKKESNEIALIMQNFSDWEKQKKLEKFEKYGKQMCWKHVSVDSVVDEKELLG